MKGFLAVCWLSVDLLWAIWSASKRFGFFLLPLILSRRGYGEEGTGRHSTALSDPVPYVELDVIVSLGLIMFIFIDTGRNSVAFRLFEPLLT